MPCRDAPGVLVGLGIYRVRVIFPPLALILQVVGGGFCHLPPEISLDHVHGKIDAAGQASRRSKVAFLDKPDAAYDMDLGKLTGEVFVCVVVSGGRLPVKPVFASTYAPTQTDMVTSAPTDDLRIHCNIT